MDNNELQHAGIKGMKWGRRRYQNPDGTWTALGKARRREGDDDDSSSKKEPEETIEQKKQRILRSKSAEEIYKNSHLFTDQELVNAVNRLASEKRLKDFIPNKESTPDEKATKEKEADEMMNKTLDEVKQRILRSKSAEEIYKNSHLFTDQEIMNVTNRLANEEKIRALIPTKKPGLREKIVDSLKTNIKSVAVETGKKFATKFIEDKLGLKEPKDPLKEIAELSKGITAVNQAKNITGKDYGDWLEDQLRKRGINPNT